MATKKASKKPATKKKAAPAAVHIAMVLDRSGSMETICDDTIGGFNRFLADQKKVKAPATISLYQFDHIYEPVYENRLVSDAPSLNRDTFVPRGTTALLDAIGRTINAMPTDRKTVVVIITDGLENASHEFTAERIKQLIAEREKDGWEFVYLGANQDAFAVAQAYGFSAGQTLSTVANAVGTQAAYGATSVKIAGYRQGLAAGDVAGAKASLSFTDAEREEQEIAKAAAKAGAGFASAVGDAIRRSRAKRGQ